MRRASVRFIHPLSAFPAVVYRSIYSQLGLHLHSASTITNTATTAATSSRKNRTAPVINPTAGGRPYKCYTGYVRSPTGIRSTATTNNNISNELYTMRNKKCCSNNSCPRRPWPPCSLLLVRTHVAVATGLQHDAVTRTPQGTGSIVCNAKRFFQQQHADSPFPSSSLSSQQREDSSHRPAPLDWLCRHKSCGAVNYASRNVCYRCGADKTHSSHWVCPHCPTTNPLYVRACQGCGEEVPAQDVTGLWTCHKCKTENSLVSFKCCQCDTPRVVKQWRCPKCSAENNITRTRCRRCSKPNPNLSSSSSSNKGSMDGSSEEAKIPNNNTNDNALSEDNNIHDNKGEGLQIDIPKDRMEGRQQEHQQGRDQFANDKMTSPATWMCAQANCANVNDHTNVCRQCGSPFSGTRPWTCPCSCRNRADAETCVGCRADRPVSWECPRCHQESTIFAPSCRRCGLKRDLLFSSYEGLGRSSSSNTSSTGQLGVADSAASCRTSHSSNDSSFPANWICSYCEQVNTGADTHCIACKFRRARLAISIPAVLDVGSKSETSGDSYMGSSDHCDEVRKSGLSSSTAHTGSHWTCQICSSLNFNKRVLCYGCGSPRSISCSSSSSSGATAAAAGSPSPRSENGGHFTGAPSDASGQRTAGSNDRGEGDNEGNRTTCSSRNIAETTTTNSNTTATNATGTWYCDLCGEENYADQRACVQCLEPRRRGSSSAYSGGKTEDSSSPVGTRSGNMKPKLVPAKRDVLPGDWHCSSCGTHNFSSRLVCMSCGIGINPSPPRPRRNTSVSTKEGDWKCLNPRCGTINFSTRAVCYTCQMPRALPPGDWVCPECQAWNFKHRMACLECGTRRPASSHSSISHYRGRGRDGGIVSAGGPGRMPTWRCDVCGFANLSNRTSCQKCMNARKIAGPWVCRECSTQNDEKTTKCEECGREREKVWLCPQCTHTNSQDLDFCGQCECAKPPVPTWECSACHHRNTTDVLHCSQCNQKRMLINSSTKIKKGIWVCANKNCGVWNFDDRFNCVHCHTLRPENITIQDAEWKCPKCKQINPFKEPVCYHCGKTERRLPGDWQCSTCECINFHFRRVCYQCNVAKEEGNNPQLTAEGEEEASTGPLASKQQQRQQQVYEQDRLSEYGPPGAVATTTTTEISQKDKDDEFNEKITFSEEEEEGRDRRTAALLDNAEMDREQEDQESVSRHQTVSAARSDKNSERRRTTSGTSNNNDASPSIRSNTSNRRRAGITTATTMSPSTQVNATAAASGVEEDEEEALLNSFRYISSSSSGDTTTTTTNNNNVHNTHPSSSSSSSSPSLSPPGPGPSPQGEGGGSTGARASLRPMYPLSSSSASFFSSLSSSTKSTPHEEGEKKDADIEINRPSTRTTGITREGDRDVTIRRDAIQTTIEEDMIIDEADENEEEFDVEGEEEVHVQQWKCTVCGNQNIYEDGACSKCGIMKP